MGHSQSDSVDFFTDLTGRMVRACPKFWSWLGRMEYEYLEEPCEKLPDIAPIYVCGMARSGSTILLEKLYQTGQFSSHRYCDYPFINIPFLWGKWIDLFLRDHEARERSHKDRLMVTAKSPEAMEELKWMQYFETLHPSEGHTVLDQSIKNPTFEKDYKHHIQKVMLRDNGKRYLAKGNYNSLRIGYISKFIETAKFIIPVRDPVSHIASLIKQHKMLCEDHTKHPKNKRYMDIIGHFEFGSGRLPLAQEGQSDVAYYAQQWSEIYGHIAAHIKSDNVHIVRYEDLCEQPEKTLQDTITFCDIHTENIAQLSKDISAPDYYTPDFSDEELRIIHEITGPIKALYY